ALFVDVGIGSIYRALGSPELIGTGRVIVLGHRPHYPMHALMSKFETSPCFLHVRLGTAIVKLVDRASYASSIFVTDTQSFLSITYTPALEYDKPKYRRGHNHVHPYREELPVAHPELGRLTR